MALDTITPIDSAIVMMLQENGWLFYLQLVEQVGHCLSRGNLGWTAEGKKQ